MLTSTLYQTCLVLHITGITAMAGATVVDSIVFRQFWKQYASDKRKAAGTIETAAKFARLIPLGFLLLLLSGVGIMALTKGLYGEQVWFRIKMALVLLTVINGIAVGQRNGRKLQRTVAAEAAGANEDARILNLKAKLGWFHAIQLLLFLLIFVLGVFKFN